MAVYAYAIRLQMYTGMRLVGKSIYSALNTEQHIIVIVRMETANGLHLFGYVCYCVW